MPEGVLLSFMDDLRETGLNDDMVVPMPECGCLIPLGDGELGGVRSCSLGRCMQWLCYCGAPWMRLIIDGCECEGFK